VELAQVSATILRALHDQKVSNDIGALGDRTYPKQYLLVHWRMRSYFFRRSYVSNLPLQLFWSFPRT
jgi:hypothetical protein